MKPGELEFNDLPKFEMSQKVRTRKLIGNDGTFPSQHISATLAKKGDIGYIVSIETYLQIA